MKISEKNAALLYVKHKKKFNDQLKETVEDGLVSKAALAKVLGISRVTLYRRLEEETWTSSEIKILLTKNIFHLS